MATGTKPKPKSASTMSWVSDKLAAGAARVNGGEFQDVEIAVVKATNHDLTQPKEKHVRALREIVASATNKKKVIYIVHALYERLVAPNESWLVVLKTLMVFHKLLKADGDSSFKQELMRYKEKRKLSELLVLNNFADGSKKESWDFSAFVRVYSSYLEERVRVFEAVRFDVDRDGGGANIRLKTATCQELLNELPRLQKLLQRMMACLPEGAAADSEVVMESMRWLLAECFRLYRVISEGVINLAEQFFEMDRVDATKGLEMYREAINGSSQMQSFFNAIQSLSIGRQIQFPQLTSPPEDFIQQMEDHVRDATGRTTTRKFPSTISRNARGTPSAALASQSDPGTTTKIVVSLEKTPEDTSVEKDLLGLDAVDLTPVEPVAPVPVPPTDPFGDVVFTSGDQGFQSAEPVKEGHFLDDWGVSTSLASPQASTIAEQNASPFDDFFGGGPMVQPPAPDSSSPVSNIQQPVQGLSGGGIQFQQTPVSNNPFGDFGSIEPVQQPVLQQQAPVTSGVFSGPGAFADPFDGLTPAIQKKTNFAVPGVPMRQESMSGNPFGGTQSYQGPSQQSGQKDFAGFF